MLSEDTVNEMEAAVRACDEAREALADALESAEAHEGDPTSDPAVMEPVGSALAKWRDAQEHFFAVVEASEASDPSTAGLLLKTNHGIDSSNARCGIPGTSVDGADQPFPLDLTGTQGGVLTQAAMEYLS